MTELVRAKNFGANACDRNGYEYKALIVNKYYELDYRINS
tara:strand:+ start:128 stop:247 length:120 start_codon:yes stop_codon:yes gene_type:complete